MQASRQAHKHRAKSRAGGHRQHEYNTCSCGTHDVFVNDHVSAQGSEGRMAAAASSSYLGRRPTPPPAPLPVLLPRTARPPSYHLPLRPRSPQPQTPSLEGPSSVSLLPLPDLRGRNPPPSPHPPEAGVQQRFEHRARQLAAALRLGAGGPFKEVKDAHPASVVQAARQQRRAVACRCRCTRPSHH